MPEEPLLTHDMMISALNRILGECGYDPVPVDDRAAADRLIADARQRADGIVAAAQETALRYTDAALDRASRTVITARQALAHPEPAAAELPRALSGAGPDQAAASVGAAWYAAVTAAGVYLPNPEPMVVQALDGCAEQLRAAVGAEPADLTAAYQVGVDVVVLGLGQAVALPGTLGVLFTHLGGPGHDVVRPSARQVLGAFVAGYAAGLQRQILAQQESLHRATQRAAQEFQRALQDSEARYRRLVYHDPVTGLPNKARLVQRLEQAARALTEARHVGICLIDVAGFAAVAEQFGADAGDHLLTAVAQRLQTLARHPDYLLARYGPRTFALLVHDNGGVAHLADLADRIVGALAEPVSLPGTGLTAQASACVGVVDVKSAGLDAGRVLVDAEIALRQAKAGTTGWAVYDPQPCGPVGPQFVPSLARLHTGPPTYQPIVSLRTGRIIGLHTGMLWRHPHLGSLDLSRIGQLTGDRATITRLAAGLLDQACHEALRWDVTADGPFIGLDLPLHQIGYPDVVELIGDALGGSGLPPARLHLHLAGLDAVPTGEHSHIVLTSLADLGVRVVLDDFGTGNTSIGYLRELPLHGLRTPAALFQPAAAGTGDAERDLLVGLARVAHALGLTLTVHGVDEDHRAFHLADTGCDAVQGLRYGPPATSHQVRVLLRGNAALVAS
jgi:diguanylate cyclase (GGDEF)-like protein